jgi:hypothetical protein
MTPITRYKASAGIRELSLPRAGNAGIGMIARNNPNKSMADKIKCHPKGNDFLRVSATV